MKFVLKLVFAVLLFALATEARSVSSENSASYGEEHQLHLSAPRSSEYQLQLAKEQQAQHSTERPTKRPSDYCEC
ncbi:hypothetical protein DICVIV_13841 [Dictyocaulus viviparus]|uniref:Secreted protein n=1 Tax=Dictyocaulus viviparus TaxID=29172 RepID=A0A0D8X9C8_DICVI|nr:hypothetical protein DICVIV_13841 [Dictyocaulus viviparus]